MRKRDTDQTVLNFGGEYPVIVEYGSFAIAEAINNNLSGVFDVAFRRLDKERRKSLRARVAFLLDQRLTCVPLGPAICESAQALLGRFVARHQLKQNFRNSMADLLILATAAESGLPLLTEDNLLARFAAEVSDAPVQAAGSFVEVRFSPKHKDVLPVRRESKGYINRGWSVRFRRAGFRVG